MRLILEGKTRNKCIYLPAHMCGKVKDASQVERTSVRYGQLFFPVNIRVVSLRTEVRPTFPQLIKIISDSQL